MTVKFKIESIFKITGRGYFVGAKCLEVGKNFQMTENSTLGDVVLTRYATMPRTIDENGSPRKNIWVFQLKEESDFDRLKEGEIVELYLNKL